MMTEAHFGEIVDSGSGYDIIECQKCRFKHVSPLPIQHENESLYRDKHYDDGERNRIEYYEKDRDWWLMSYQDVLNDIHQISPPSINKTLLDIGCGAGLFLESAKQAGWNTIGIEISTIAARHCQSKGLSIINKSFNDDLSELPAKIDVIHMRNILEHVPDPYSLIKTAYNNLAEGGVLIVGVPNDYNPIQVGLRNVENYKPWWIAVPHHLNYFNFSSLENLVEKCGFDTISRFSSFPIDLFLTMGENYIEEPHKGRECHGRRVNFEWFMEKAELSDLRRKIYKSFADLDLGREAIVIAKKK